MIEQRDGPIGMGHDDAWRDDRLQLGHPNEPRVDARVKDLREMAIGRTDDPEIPLKPVALEAA